MDKSQESQVKKLIMGANLALEAHKFGKAKQICLEALKIESDNPNIYMIMLLADYRVTEIEHLEKCDVDTESENYKNVRRYAGKELNDELNKYVSDKGRKDKNTYDSFLTGFNLDALLGKLTDFIKTKGYKGLLEDFFGYDYLTFEKYEKKLLQKYNEDKSILLKPKDDKIVKTTSPILILSFSPIFIAFLLALLICLIEGKNYHLIVGPGFLVGCALFSLRIKAIYYHELIIKIPKKKNTFFEKISSTIVSFAGTVVSFLAIYYLYYIYFDLASPMRFYHGYIIKILSVFIGLIPQRIIPFCSQQLYSFIKNFSYLLEEEPRKRK